MKVNIRWLSCLLVYVRTMLSESDHVCFENGRQWVESSAAWSIMVTDYDSCQEISIRHDNQFVLADKIRSGLTWNLSLILWKSLLIIYVPWIFHQNRKWGFRYLIYKWHNTDFACIIMLFTVCCFHLHFVLFHYHFIVYLCCISGVWLLK
jgi:hypothetical protein